jgi:exosortase E/protease (VPEID-CTERM system)
MIPGEVRNCEAAHDRASYCQTAAGSGRERTLVRSDLTLSLRLAIAAVVLFLEKAALNFFVDFPGAQSAQGLGALVRIAQHWGFRFIVSLVIAAAVFAYLRGGPTLAAADWAARGVRVRRRYLALHLAALLPLVPLSMSLYGRATLIPFWLVAGLWIALALLAAAALFAALAPWPLWRRGAQALGVLWAYAVGAAAGAVAAMGSSQQLWTGMARITFEAVRGVLGYIIPDLQIDPANLVIDAGNFAVYIDPVCSGLEGVTLMLAFCLVLLVLFRRELIFPRALLVIPAGVILVVVLNVIRIAALVLIGNAGHPDVAVYGFHSQAGWLAFNAASAGVALVSLRSPWLSRTASRSGVQARNPTAAYLLPFLALLLAGMLSKAASSGFERLYWLRLLAVAPALWYAWPRLEGASWRVGWRAPLVGIAVFAMWVVVFRLVSHSWGLSSGMPEALAAATPLQRVLWIAAHLVLSVALIPLAEELAFRGFLLRRLRSADFEQIMPGTVGAVPLLLSSLAFGLCHGSLWLPGTIAGLAFGLLYMRAQRLGDPLAAHATANALLAACVLWGGQWQLW